MGTIHFVSDLESSALKALKDAEDCADIVNDLGRIYYTITHGSEQDARALDHEMPKVFLLRNQICNKTTGGLFAMRQSKRELKRA